MVCVYGMYVGSRLLFQNIIMKDTYYYHLAN